MTMSLREQVLMANRALAESGLVHETFGNVSGIDRGAGQVVIKPSGVPYERLTAESMVPVRLEDGRVMEGDLRPSSDTPTHLALYRALRGLGGIAHTHSVYATAWAQARQDIPPLGTTHADYCCGPVPCTRMLRPEEIRDAYEANTAGVIVERVGDMDPLSVPGVLVAGHGPFTWGRSAAEAVRNAARVEYIARLACETMRIDPEAKSIPDALLEKHFHRKHGPGAYYGQEKPS